MAAIGNFGNGNDGTLSGFGYVAGSGWAGSNTAANPHALALDGVNDYVSCGDKDTFSFTSGASDLPFSVAAWVWFDPTATGLFPVCSKWTRLDPFDEEYSVTISSAGLVSLQCLCNGTDNRIRKTSDVSITKGVWVHVATTYSGSETVTGINIYINGLPVAATGITDGSYVGMVNRTAPLVVGSFLQGAPSRTVYAKGAINSLQIYPLELTPEQVAVNYAAGMVWPRNLGQNWLMFGI